MAMLHLPLLIALKIPSSRPLPMMSFNKFKTSSNRLEKSILLSPMSLDSALKSSLSIRFHVFLLLIKPDLSCFWINLILKSLPKALWWIWFQLPKRSLQHVRSLSSFPQDATRLIMPPSKQLSTSSMPSEWPSQKLSLLSMTLKALNSSASSNSRCEWNNSQYDAY